MKYILRFDKPHEQSIEVTIEMDVAPGPVQFHLPAWRPGRYESQNFPRFVADEKAHLEGGMTLQVQKRSIHSWEIEVPEAGKLSFSYRFFANLKDAGGTYLDEERLLVNGITIFMYNKEKMGDACELEINLPQGWKIGGGFSEEGPRQCFADYHQLVDTPFLAGKELFHHSFDVRGIPTHLWFLGDCHPDFPQLENDIAAYSEAQLELFGSFPVDQYHYLFVAWPFPYRHGVEHFNSTVIVMGPGHRLMQGKYYESLLEISSHELFHTWNVKLIRPKDMFPYDYSQPNYSKLHYVTEGVTTYYGDLMLWKGEVWKLDRWVKSINGELLSHYSTGAQDHISLEEASFQSWTNGYRVETVPNRKISFYTKGYLVAMLLDFVIRKKSKGLYSLDELMRRMYEDIGKQGRPYGEEDYKGLAEEMAGESLDDFWDKYIRGTENLVPALKELGEYMGMALIEVPPPKPAWNWWGMEVKNEDGKLVVEKLYENGAAKQAGLHIGDELVAIGGRKIGKDLNEWLTYLEDGFRVEVHFFHHGKLKTAQLPLASEGKMRIPQFILKGNPNEEQVEHMRSWQQVSLSKAYN